MTYPVKSPRKLIEVALPLDAINAACAREKSIRHGHPSTLHLWWARRPLAAARAVIFAQLVNDPSWRWEMERPGEIPPNNLKASWAASRKRLFKIIEDLVLWENTTNEEVLEKARNEIRKSWRETCELNRDHPKAAELFNPDKPPALHDPFAGGGAIPLEAQRLGLEAYASDLNPVAVLINKAMIEIPPKFVGLPPVSQGTHLAIDEFPGATGLAEDVRYYGAWMREEAQKRIGRLYPPVEITPEIAQDRPDLKPLVGRKLTVIAWLWARTVKSPNPAFSHADVPLASTFILSSKPGKEAYVQPVVEGDSYRFTVKIGRPPEDTKNGTKSGGSGSTFKCLLSGYPLDFAYLRDEAKQGRMKNKLMAIVADGDNGRIYLPPTKTIENIAINAVPEWKPETQLPEKALGFRIQEYGMLKWADLFTPRQLTALTTFSDLVGEAREKIRRDAELAWERRRRNSPSPYLGKGSGDEGDRGQDTGLDAGGMGPAAYAEAVSVYLAFAVDRIADSGSSLTSWSSPRDSFRNTFGRQALPMVWDYAETNPVNHSAGSFFGALEWISKVLTFMPSIYSGKGIQFDAQTQTISSCKIISTDPPYYDNIGYADLSDFFYVWLRKSLREVFPNLLATIAVPKAEELIASPYRHGGRREAERFFLDGMTGAMQNIASQAHPAAPITIYYAFKQSETKGDGTASSGWETFLEAVNRAGLCLTGTWPMRTELSNRMIGSGANALASSIVLVCRKRAEDAPTISRRAFLRELNAILPEALDEMTRGAGGEHSPVAPVDLSQAIIGPGMAVFSKYSAVLEADGTPLSVREALKLINRFLAEEDFDPDTQFCLRWFEQYGWEEGVYGEADVLSRSKGASVDGMKDANVLESGGGKVRLLKWSEYPSDWDPVSDKRTPVWEALHQLIRALRQDGESASGALLASLGGKAEAIRQLAYRLYTLCERQDRAEDARAYNELITSWGGIEIAAAQSAKGQDQQLLDI
jgi:putative DNA methylase